MNLFKKKYKRDDYYQGVLDAEELMKEGWHAQATSHELRGCTEYENGVYDYIEYKRNVLEKLK